MWEAEDEEESVRCCFSGHDMPIVLMNSLQLRSPSQAS